METECLRPYIAKTKINRDVIVLYMLSKKYKIDLLSLIVLYEIFGKDVFLFFYVLSTTNSDVDIVGKTLEELELGDSLINFPKESNLKLMFTKAQKISDALRRNTSVGLTSITLPWYEQLQEFCVRDANNETYLDFYSSEVVKVKPKRRGAQTE